MFEPLFNLHDVMLLMTAGLSVLLAVPMLLQRQRQSSDMILAMFIMTQGLAALYFLFLYSSVLRPLTIAAIAPFQIFPLITLFWLQGVLLFSYARVMGGYATGFTKGDVIVALSLFGLPLMVVLLVWSMGIWTNHGDGMPLTMPVLIASIVYGIRALGLIRKHEQRIRERHSNIDDIELIWLSYAAYGFIVVWCCRLAGYIATSQFWTEFWSTSANIPAIILIASMVILGLRRGQYTLTVDGSAPKREQTKDSKRHNPELTAKLEDLMVRVKVYQDPDLSLEGLADSLGTSPRTLSSLINGHYQQNFYDFVNHYRVLEAKTRLQDPENEQMTIQRIFEDAGFKSKSTFNTFFKKATGKTPSEFRRRDFAIVTNES